MKPALKKLTSPYLFALVGLVLFAGLVAADSLSPGGRKIVKITGIDAVSYYAVTHSLVFDRDFDLTNQYQNLNPLPNRWQETRPETGLPGSPFPLGYSLLAAPFLKLGSWCGQVIQGADSGYGPCSMLFYFSANILFCCLGLFFAHKWFMAVAGDTGLDPAPGPAMAAVWLLWAGSTIAYYTFSPMSHMASFMALSLYLFALWRAKDTGSHGRWVLCGLGLGLATLCRWQNALYVLLPVIFEAVRLLSPSRRAEIASLKKYLLSRALFALTILVVFSPQFLEWKAIYDSYFTVPQGPGFLAFPPAHVPEVLFSSQKGFFIWTPLAFLGVAGLLAALPRSPAAMAGLVLTLALQVILIGSLAESWMNIASFGQRLLTGAYVIPALGVFLLLARAKGIRRLVLYGLALLLAAFTVAFGAQFRLDTIPKDDRLTWQELVPGKIFIADALERKQLTADAQRAFEQGDAAKALSLADRARQAAGLNRHLAELYVAIYQALGDPQATERSRKELQTLLDSRLF